MCSTHFRLDSSSIRLCPILLTFGQVNKISFCSITSCYNQRSSFTKNLSLHFIAMSKRRVTDFFKPKVSACVSEEKDAEPPIKAAPNSTVVQQHEESTAVEKPFHPTKDYAFPKSRFGNRDRSCQHQWFKDFPWLNYDER